MALRHKSGILHWGERCRLASEARWHRERPAMGSAMHACKAQLCASLNGRVRMTRPGLHAEQEAKPGKAGPGVDCRVRSRKGWLARSDPWLRSQGTAHPRLAP